VPGSPLISYVSQSNSDPGFAPRWKGTATLDWKKGPLSANLAGRYVGRYKDYQLYAPNSNALGNSWIMDVNLRTKWAKHLPKTTAGWLVDTSLWQR